MVGSPDMKTNTPDLNTPVVVKIYFLATTNFGNSTTTIFVQGWQEFNNHLDTHRYP